MSAPLHIHDLSRGELASLLETWGFPAFHASRIWRSVYHGNSCSPAAIAEVPPRLRERLSDELDFSPLAESNQVGSSDSHAQKYLLRLSDGRQVETVRMRFPGRVTACLSSQAGCPLQCQFCATGQQGFDRNLSTGEIVSQAMHVVHTMPDRLRNVVLMGMGEPLLNYRAVVKALDILRDSAGLAIAAKRITISTAGIVPSIVRLADEAQPYSLAVSLHAATQEERAGLMPIANAWPLDELMGACRYYVRTLGRRIFFEWTLIEGQNDSPQQACTLAELLAGLRAHVNLIPLNLTAGYQGRPSATDAMDRFQAILAERGIPSTVRQKRGLDIAAGCGQLAGRATAALN